MPRNHHRIVATCGMIAAFLLFVSANPVVAVPTSHRAAYDHAQMARKAVGFSYRWATGWLAHADPETGLLPSRVDRPGGDVWQPETGGAKITSAIALLALVSDQHHLIQSAEHILETEKRLTNRIDSLPDAYDFETATFRTNEPQVEQMIANAATYAGDGLLPIVEYAGMSLWSQRMLDLSREVWKQGRQQGQAGDLPSSNPKVNAALLQVFARTYWMTRDEMYKQWVYRICDHYLLKDKLSETDRLDLSSNTAPLIAALAEGYALAAYADPDKKASYHDELHVVLDGILQFGLNEDGMVFSAVDLQAGRAVDGTLTPAWGEIYYAFMTVSQVDNEPLYAELTAMALSQLPHLSRNRRAPFPTLEAKAHSMASAIRLLSRVEAPETVSWIDGQVNRLIVNQDESGLIEGNAADAAVVEAILLHGLHRSLGITASPWRTDLAIGATLEPDGACRVYLSSERPWRGRLRFDRPRHEEVLHLPVNYPRSGEIPEWFTVRSDQAYAVQMGSGNRVVVSGTDLRNYEISMRGGADILLSIRETDEPLTADTVAANRQPTPPTQGAPATRPPTPPAATTRPERPEPQREPADAAPETQPGFERTMRYTSRRADRAMAWQESVRNNLISLMRIGDLVSNDIPVNAQIQGSTQASGYVRQTVKLNATESRSIEMIVTIPQPAPKEKVPAIIIVGDQRSEPASAFESNSSLRGVGSVLASQPVVTVALSPGDQQAIEPNRTAVGEQVWNLMRAMDYVETLTEVDPSKTACVGVGIGGQMAMFLGALDTRVEAVATAGFLQSVTGAGEPAHASPAWRLDGLSTMVDYADVYSLVAPRPLQCQVGIGATPAGMGVAMARRSFQEITPIYKDLEAPNAVSMKVHPGDIELDVPMLMNFLKEHLDVK